MYVGPVMLLANELVIFNVELFIDVVVPSIVIGVGTAICQIFTKHTVCENKEEEKRFWTDNRHL